MRKALNIIGDLVHQMQRERGCSALFLGSFGKNFINEIKNQFESTDKAITAFKEKKEVWQYKGSLDAGILMKVDGVLQNISVLNEQRKTILSLACSPSVAINYYTYEAISPLLDIAVETAFFDKNTNPAKITAYSNFLYWKERAGRERAIGMRGFLSHTFSNQEFVERMDFLIKEQAAYQRTFVALADKKQNEALENVMGSPTILRVDKVHQHMEKAPDSPILEAMTAEGWYELMTHKIDIMHQVECALIDTLEGEELTSEGIDGSSKIARVSNISQKHYDFICTLPFFSGLSENILNNLLQHAQTKEYKKGKLLFLEGEHTTRFYIIVRGWVKLFKGTVAGDEAILQMLSGGDAVAESSVFLNAPYPVSAQIAEDAVLLTFPAPIIREYIRSSNELAVNMLTSMSLRSQTLIHQVESTRLKTAKDRVGWFLLKLMLDKDWSLDAVELPYDKAMIASYLDMKPETFSRTLKLFKEHGFKIENDTIILPNIKSLCGYCDIDTTLQCSKHSTPDCPNSECSQKQVGNFT